MSVQSQDSTASQFGITEDALAEIRETVAENLNLQANVLAQDPHWTQRIYEMWDRRRGALWVRRFENFARTFGTVLHSAFLAAAEQYTEMLTKTIIEHQRTRRPVPWESIFNQAKGFCESFEKWEHSAVWLAEAFETADLDQKYIGPREQSAFLSSLSKWGGLSPSWLEDHLARKIRHIARLAPERKPIRGQRPAPPAKPIELPTLKEIRSLVVITQKQAAHYLDCTPRTIYSFVQQRRLNKTSAGKICCDDKLVVEMRKKYPNIRLM